MELLPLDKLGAREIVPGTIQFGVFFPWVSAQNGNRVFVKVIHENDQFLQNIQPFSFELTHSLDPVYGDYWACQIDLSISSSPPNSSWGQTGTYVYRYEIHNPNVGILDWITDPFAREFGVGKLSAFTLGFQEHPWSVQETTWKTPLLNDLIFYELQLEEFGENLEGALDRLTYLADLGVNCLEIMPISNVALTVDWGYLPIGYFGVDERLGNRRDLQQFVDIAHQLGLAVVLDVVYGHTAVEFPYCDLYRRLHYQQNPFLGDFAKNYFGESTNFALKFTQDFFYTVNYLWLDRFHVDGFRYDCVPNYWDGPQGVGYANLTYSTYQLVKGNIANSYWHRFNSNGQVALVQCAEQLEDPTGVLNQSYSNCTWQNLTLDAAKSVPNGSSEAITQFGQRLGLEGFPTSVNLNGEQQSRTALQYIENHDHERFICQFGLERQTEGLFQNGNRDRWYKLQPYLIGLLLAKGIPLLWQGQEFCENYWLPPEGLGRVLLLRPVRWDYFYDEIGKSIVGLTRRLLHLRRQNKAFRGGEHFFYNDPPRYQSRGLLLFSRYINSHFSLIALNFSDIQQTVPFWFPLAGNYVEQLDNRPQDVLFNVPALTEISLDIPSNYGRVWSLE